MADGVIESQETGISPYQGVTDQFLQSLKDRGVMKGTETHQKMGVLAIGGTNETGDGALFEKVRSQNQPPDGYLIGIGAANVFSMLEAFPEGSEPKAILLFDIDPQVVAVGQAIIEHFKTSDTYPTSLLGQPDENGYFKGEIFPKGFTSQFKAAVKKYSSLLHKLSHEGRFAMAQVDFTNPVLVEEISNLPDLKNSNNVIYLSNIADHIWRLGRFNPDFSFLNTISPDSPHHNYYIDTLLKGLGYRLRIGTNPPYFDMTDFGDRDYDTYFQTKPTDQIEGLSENPIWEDLGSWPLQNLLQAYDHLGSQPLQKERREWIERLIREGRQSVLTNFEDWKKLAGKPKQLTENIYSLYVLPTDLEEERQLKAELGQDYSYDGDFIPFLAHTYWGNAVSPLEVDLEAIPKLDNYRREGDKTYLVHDVRNSKKGRTEINLLRKVPFEELAMAKIYRETEKRLLKRNPKVDTTGKDINQLADQLQFGRPADK